MKRSIAEIKEFIARVRFPSEEAMLFDDRMSYDEAIEYATHAEFGDPELAEVLRQEAHIRSL